MPGPRYQEESRWKGLYLAALFETDRAKLLLRIAEAEQALVERARELFSAKSDTIEEAEAIDDAMYALHALRGVCPAVRPGLLSSFPSA